MPENAKATPKHVFFTAHGYDNFRKSNRWTGNVEFATLDSSEYETKTREDREFLLIERNPELRKLVLG